MRSRFFSLSAILILLLPACIGRYDDGPEVNVWPVRDKIINEWKWAYAVENGVNRTGELSGYTIEFTRDDSVKTCSPEGNCEVGYWNLISKKQKLQLIYGDSAIAFDITRIKMKELWLIRNDTIKNQKIRWELVDADGKRIF
jgi:hypothetical protein